MFRSSDNVEGVVAPVIGMPSETQPQAHREATFVAALYQSQKRRTPVQFFNARRNVFERKRARVCLVVVYLHLTISPSDEVSTLSSQHSRFSMCSLVFILFFFMFCQCVEPGFTCAVLCLYQSEEFWSLTALSRHVVATPLTSVLRTYNSGKRLSTQAEHSLVRGRRTSFRSRRKALSRLEAKGKLLSIARRRHNCAVTAIVWAMVYASIRIVCLARRNKRHPWMVPCQTFENMCDSQCKSGRTDRHVPHQDFEALCLLLLPQFFFF